MTIYIVRGKIYDDTGSASVIVGGAIFQGQGGGAPPTWLPTWAHREGKLIGTGAISMYPKNAASPQRVAIGPVVQISDGAVQTTGVSVKVMPQGGAASAGGGTIAYEEGIVHYLPTQAETNYASFMLIAYKTGCIPATCTVVTTASGTAGYAGLDWSVINAPTTTVGLSGTTIKTATDVETDTADIQSRLPAALLGGRIDSIGNGYEIGAVWFDTGGSAGAVSYVNGITSNPCSSPTNTKTLLTALNLKVIRVVNASSYTAEATYTGYSFIGEKWTFAPASQQIINCYLKGATITSGTFNAASTGCQFDHCHLSTVTMPAGNTATSATTLYQCGLNGTFTVNAAGIFNFINCYEEVAAGGEFTLDFAAVGATTIHMDSFTGLLTVANMAAGDVLELSGWGRLTIAASCTAGTVYISGNISLVNGGSGQTINDTSRYNEDQAVATVNGLAANVITAAATATDFGTEVFNAVVTSQLTESYAADNTAPTVAQALFLIQQMLSEKAVASTTLTVKKLDGSTTAATFTLDSSSAPTSITRTT